LKKLLELSIGGILEHIIPQRGKIPARTIIEKKKAFEMKSLLDQKELKEGKFSSCKILHRLQNTSSASYIPCCDCGQFCFFGSNFWFFL